MRNGAKVHTCGQFFDHIAKPDYRDFMADTTKVRAAMHAALSHFHLHEWVFEEHKTNPANVFGCSSNSAFMGHLITNECADFVLIKDVANAQKHFSLTRGSPSIAGAQNIAVRATGWDEGGYDEGPWGGSPSVIIDMGSGSIRHFSAVLRNVHEMWTRLFQSQGW